MSAEANNYKGMGEYRTKVSCIKVILISSIKKINSDSKLLRKQHRWKTPLFLTNPDNVD